MARNYCNKFQMFRRSLATMDYSNFFTDLCLRRQDFFVRKIAENLHKKNSDILSLAGGVPHPANFPFESAVFKLKDGTTMELDSKMMTSAQQYTQATGIPDVINLLKAMVKKYHNPPLFDQMDLIITTGSQDAQFSFCSNVLEEGDYIIVQEPTYPGFVSLLQPYNCRVLAVNYDEEGMCPDHLRRLLSRWKPGSKSSDAPKLMYVNPTGANPSGVTFSLQRKKQLYKIAQEYNLFILEDDAYYFLQFTEQRVPSFLSLDTDGRVLRTDTFSKVIAPGLRMGIATGPKEVIKKMEKQVHVSTQMPPAISQVILYKLLTQWGDEGFEQHVKRCVAYYKNQRDKTLESCKKWLTGLAEWNTPTGGLFLWMKILGVKDVDKMLVTTAVKKGVMTVPGKYASGNPDIPTPYVRIAFSQLAPDDIDRAIQRLAATIKEERLLESVRNA